MQRRTLILVLVLATIPCGGCAIVAIAAGIAAGSALIAKGVEDRQARERANSNQPHPGRQEGAVAKKEDLSAPPRYAPVRRGEGAYAAAPIVPITTVAAPVERAKPIATNEARPAAPPRSKDVMSLMRKDLSQRETNVEKFADYCEVDVPSDRHGEFLLLKGVYAWSIFVATLDKQWKTETLENFRRAADCGITEPSELMGEHWNNELQSNWSVATKR